MGGRGRGIGGARTSFFHIHISFKCTVSPDNKNSEIAIEQLRLG